MDTQRFDTIAKALATRRSRRQALQGGSAAVAGSLLAAVTTRAQGTPNAAAPMAKEGSTLFVQTAA